MNLTELRTSFAVLQMFPATAVYSQVHAQPDLSIPYEKDIPTSLEDFTRDLAAAFNDTLLCKTPYLQLSRFSTGVAFSASTDMSIFLYFAIAVKSNWRLRMHLLNPSEPSVQLQSEIQSLPPRPE